MGSESYRPCRACGSLLCQQDDDCPSCDNCGRRGHLSCYRDPPRQPAPAPNDGPAVWDLVIADMRARDHVGRRKYGTPLQAHNGRDTLQDAYEEALDLAVYLRTLIAEREGGRRG